MSDKIAALRQQLPIYGAGVFSNSNVTISSIIVPLWALYLDVSPGVIGILLGVRHFPGLLFAIHGGVLLDRLGARPVMIAWQHLGQRLQLAARVKAEQLSLKEAAEQAGVSESTMRRTVGGLGES